MAVASASIHHLPPDDKRVLYKSIYDHVAPGGCFFNLDTMNPRDEYLRARYRAVRDAREERRSPAQQSTSFAHYMDPVEDHLAFMREAGFAPVDCFWKHLTLVGGFKPG